MTGRLQEKVAVVTGAGSGIGRATVLLFASEGARVVAVDIDGEAAERAAAEIRGAGGQARGAAVDVAREDQVRALMQGVVSQEGRIDVLVNHAGIGFPGTVVETEEADWDRLMDVNVKGVFLGCKHAIPVMERQGGGVIVNTASAVARVGIRNRAAYGASKGAVAALTQAMALDHVGAGIRINCVGPGTIHTPYIEGIMARSAEARAELEARQAMNRLGTPEEIARAILFLASEDSSFCTGTLLLADGGWTAQ